MTKISMDRGEQDGIDALALMEQALALLDRSDCNLEAGAHLDLAICRLRESLGPLTPLKTDAANTDLWQAQTARGSERRL
jgi:hypothetical protein